MGTSNDRRRPARCSTTRTKTAARTTPTVSDDDSCEYDREFATPLSVHVRRRLGYDCDHGDVTRFVVQLEYRHGGEWVEIVRSDHDPASEHGHDVREAGVHVDIYRDGETVDTEDVFPPTDPATRLTVAEAHFSEHAEQYITSLSSGMRSETTAQNRRRTR